MTEHEKKYNKLIKDMGGLKNIIPLLPATKKEIKTALKEGEGLNLIALHRWDLAAGRLCVGPWAEKAGDYRMSRGAWPKGLSLSERVCILKHAARLWIADERHL